MDQLKEFYEKNKKYITPQNTIYAIILFILIISFLSSFSSKKTGHKKGVHYEGRNEQINQYNMIAEAWNNQDMYKFRKASLRLFIDNHEYPLIVEETKSESWPTYDACQNSKYDGLPCVPVKSYALVAKNINIDQKVLLTVLNGDKIAFKHYIEPIVYKVNQMCTPYSRKCSICDRFRGSWNGTHCAVPQFIDDMCFRLRENKHAVYRLDRLRQDSYLPSVGEGCTYPDFSPVSYSQFKANREFSIYLRYYTDPYIAASFYTNGCSSSPTAFLKRNQQCFGSLDNKDSSSTSTTATTLSKTSNTKTSHSFIASLMRFLFNIVIIGILLIIAFYIYVYYYAPSDYSSAIRTHFEILQDSNTIISRLSSMFNRQRYESISQTISEEDVPILSGVHNNSYILPSTKQEKSSKPLTESYDHIYSSPITPPESSSLLIKQIDDNSKQTPLSSHKIQLNAAELSSDEEITTPVHNTNNNNTNNTTTNNNTNNNNITSTDSDSDSDSDTVYLNNVPIPSTQMNDNKNSIVSSASSVSTMTYTSSSIKETNNKNTENSENNNISTDQIIAPIDIKSQ